MEESNFFQTQLQNFQQQNRRNSGQMKHPTPHHKGKALDTLLKFFEEVKKPTHR